MPGYLLIVDRDSDRRAECAAAGAARLATLSDRPLRRFDTPWFSALVSAGPRVPLGFAHDERGAAMILGSLRRQGTSEELDAAGLLATSASSGWTRMESDGFGLRVRRAPAPPAASLAGVSSRLVTFGDSRIGAVSAHRRPWGWESGFTSRS